MVRYVPPASRRATPADRRSPTYAIRQHESGAPETLRYEQVPDPGAGMTAGDLFSRSLTAMAAIGARIMQRSGGMRYLEASALQAATDGRWRALTTRFPLADAAGARAALEGRRTVGKTVLVP